MTTRPDSLRRRWALPALIVLVLAGAFTVGLMPVDGAQSQDRNFAGSVQASYLYVPTDPEARDISFDGFVTELGLKLAVDFSDHVSANVKVCYGCHGFEVAMAFVDKVRA